VFYGFASSRKPANVACVLSLPVGLPHNCSELRGVTVLLAKLT
jgi:hypothetical protein